MSDFLTDSLQTILPGYNSAQATVALGALLAGFFLGGGLGKISEWWSERQRRINADDALRKLTAKRLNEHLKLFSSFCNTVGAAILGAAFILPYIKEHATPQEVDWRWVGASLGLHLVGHISLLLMKSEA